MNDSPEKKELRSPFAIFIGSKIELGGEGNPSCEIQVEDQLRNNNGMLHGGAIFTVIDNAMGAAAKKNLRPDELSATLEIQITYLRPVKDGTVHCEAEVVKRGKRMVFLKANATLDGELVARATGTYAISKRS